MASNPTATLSSLLGSTSIIDHEEVLKATNAVLKSSKANQDAIHTRVVALLKLDRFADALRALDEGGDKLAQRCALEKAYALYKTGQLDEAEKLMDGTATKSRGLKHLAALVAYRAERFEDAAKVYKELSTLEGAIAGEENDLRINTSAVDTQLEWQGNGDKVEPSRKKPGREDLEAFETAYNAACGYIARGELGHGSVLLKRARDLCEGLDELSEEEKRAEILPIMVQQAYVFTRMGKVQEAETIQKMINISDVPEPPTRVIAQNNALASLPQTNPYLTERTMSSVPNLTKSDRLFEYQANILRRNRYTIDLQCQKFEGVGRSTIKFLSREPSPTISSHINSISALNASAHTHSETSKASIKKLLPLLQRRPGDVGLIMTIIQVYVLTNNPGPATALLESFFKRLEESTAPADLDVRFAPGLVALLVSLHRLEGRKASIRAELDHAASYWRQKSSPPQDLLKAAGSALLESSKPEHLKAAGEIFESLRKQDPQDRQAIASFVASKATTDFAAVEADLAKLTPIDNLIAGVDAAALEDGGIASLPIVMSEAGKKRSAPAEQEKHSKKRIRKAQLPKDFEEGKKMDPERWLPLKDRSTYRPKGKKGKKKALDTTQGGIIKEEESLELVGGAGAVKVEKAPQGGGKNKKKKGKK